MRKATQPAAARQQASAMPSERAGGLRAGGSIDSRSALLSLQGSAGNRAVSGLVQQGIPAQQNIRRAAGSSIGDKLPDSVAAKFGHLFGRDLSHVTVHHDSAASQAVSEVGSNAFAMGDRIFFREGAYRLETDAGQSLLAHELAHVVQQTRASGGNTAGRNSGVRNTAESEAAARRAAESHAEGAETLPSGPDAPVYLAADNGVAYEDPEQHASVLSTENDLLDKIVTTEAEANQQREAAGVTDFETAKLDTEAYYLRDEAKKIVSKEARNPNRRPKMPVSSPDLRDASKEEIAGRQRELLKLDLTVKDPKDRDVIARDVENTARMSDYASKTFNIVIGGHGVFGLREHEATAMLRGMMSDLESDTQYLERQVYNAHELRQNTSSWVTGPVHFWGGAWDEIEPEDFQKTNILRGRAQEALKKGDIDEAENLLRDSYYEYEAVNDRFADYQEGIQRGGGRMIKLLSTAERAGRGALTIVNPLAGAAYSFGQDSLQQEEMVRRGLLDKIDWTGNLKNAAWTAVVGKVTGAVSKFVGGATQPFAGTFGSKALAMASGIGTSSALTRTNPIDAFSDPASWISMGLSMGYSAPGVTEPAAVPNEPANPNTAVPNEPVTSTGMADQPAPAPVQTTPGPPEPATPLVTEPSPPNSAEPTAPIAANDEAVQQQPPPRAIEALNSALDTADPSSQVSRLETADPSSQVSTPGVSSLANEPDPNFTTTGSGHTQWTPVINVDEPGAVGEPGITPAESMRRAMDLSSRQFIDAMTNQATKGEKVEVPSSARSAPDLSPTSVAANPAALLTRPRLGGILEWDQLSADVLSKKAASLVGKTAKQVKNILNRALREELKNPTTSYGRAISEALSEMLGVPAEEMFRKTKVRVIRKPSGQF